MQTRDGSEEPGDRGELGLLPLLLSGFVGVVFAALILLIRHYSI